MCRAEGLYRRFQGPGWHLLRLTRRTTGRASWLADARARCPAALQDKKEKKEKKDKDPKEKKEKSEKKDKGGCLADGRSARGQPSERAGLRFWLVLCPFRELQLAARPCSSCWSMLLSRRSLTPRLMLRCLAGDKKDKKEKSASDKLADVKASGKGKANGAAAPAAAPAKPARPAPRRPPQPEAKGKADDYLAGLDLPSSESESDEEVDRRRSMLGEEEAPRIQQAVRRCGCCAAPFLLLPAA